MNNGWRTVGLLIGMPVVVLPLLVNSYGVLCEAVPYRWSRLMILLDAFRYGVHGVGVLDLVGAVGMIIFAVTFGLLMGGSGLWLSYHAFFGNHSERPRK